jgi:hypothetical protein
MDMPIDDPSFSKFHPASKNFAQTTLRIIKIIMRFSKNFEDNKDFGIF